MGGWLRHLPALHSTLTSALGETVELRSSDGGSTVCVKAIYQRPAVITDEVGGVDYRGSDHKVTLKATDLPAWCDRGAYALIRDRGPVLTLDVVELAPDGQGLVTLWCRRAA